jgi:RNA polymerase sigma factor (sigma-70 family)
VATFPAWAYRIVTRRCLRASAGAERSIVAGDASDIDPLLDTSSAPGAELSVDVSRVLDAVRQLPAAQRATMALFYLEDLSLAEIAVATDVSPGTVKTRLLHARRKVRALLEGDDS